MVVCKGVPYLVYVCICKEWWETHISVLCDKKTGMYLPGRYIILLVVYIRSVIINVKFKAMCKMKIEKMLILVNSFFK